MDMNLLFTHTGIGITVYNTNVIIDHEYGKVAIIATDRTINYKRPVTFETSNTIAKFARFANPMLNGEAIFNTPADVAQTDYDAKAHILIN